jgi:hypothetical protein
MADKIDTKKGIEAAASREAQVRASPGFFPERRCSIVVIAIKSASADLS